MKDFEELLQEALQDVREAEPLAGLEARVMARVTDKAESGVRWRLLSGAVVAGLLAAVLFHAGTRLRTRPPLAVSRMVASGTECLKSRTYLSAEGATHISLGRRPRYTPHNIDRGLKARHIVAASTVSLRDQPAHSRLPRNGSLNIPAVVIEPLRMEPIELASLTLKNGNQTGETR